MSFEENFIKFSRLFPEFTSQLSQAEEQRVLPLKEIDWIPSLQLDQVEDLIIYGVGKGEAYGIFKSWLHQKPTRTLILLEPHFGVLKALLYQEEGDQILSNPQVQLFPVPYNQNIERIAMRLAVQSSGRKILFLKDPREPAETYLAYLQTFKFNKEAFKWHILENRVMGGAFFSNFYQNLQQLPFCHAGMDLFGQLKNIPAFIVGAGPSLAKNGSILKQARNKGLIFAGGSSIKALHTLGIKPDLGFGIDPNKSQKIRLQGLEIDYPYLFRLRVHAGVLPQIKGDKIYVPGSGGYKISHWFSKELGLKTINLAEGHNIVNFMTSLAIKMGCNPIIFVGLDLSFTDHHLYAPGITLEYPFEDVTDALDIYGGVVKTRMLWLKERQWIYELVKKHPHIQFYNATEGGIVHLPITQLQEILSTLNEQKIEIHYKPLEVTLHQIHAAVLKMQESLKELREIFVRQRRSKDPKDPLWQELLSKNIAYVNNIKDLTIYTDMVIGYSHAMYFLMRDNQPDLLEFEYHRIDYLIKAIDLQLLLIHKYFWNSIHQSKNDLSTPLAP